MAAKSTSKTSKSVTENEPEAELENGAAASGPKGAKGDGIALLKEQHQKIKDLLGQRGTTTDEDLIGQIAALWIPHVLVEEEVILDPAREQASDKELFDIGDVDRDLVRIVLADLIENQGGDKQGAKLAVLCRQISEIIDAEEKDQGGLLALAIASGVDVAGASDALRQRMNAFVETAEEGPPQTPKPRFLRVRGFGERRRSTEYQTMARQSTMRDRDDQGRFVSDDDDRGGGRRSGGRDDNGRFMSEDDNRRGGRGSARDRDENGRFMSEDDNRRGGRSSGRDWDDDDNRRGGRSSGGRDRDEYGRFMSEDDDYGRHRGGGWSGGSEGHSEGSRGGWDERGGGGSSSRGGGYRGSGSNEDTDRDYGSRASSRYDDDRRGGSRSRGGWFVDREGHAEAAWRGWEGRGGSRARSSSYNDDRGRDDDRGGRYSDDDRGSRSRSRDDDDRQSSGSRGHGGWFGDSEGHSQAARRGWQGR